MYAPYYIMYLRELAAAYKYPRYAIHARAL